MTALEAAGIYDVPASILEREIKKLFSESEDIETVILGRQEYLTLTHLRIIDEKGPRDSILMIIRGS